MRTSELRRCRCCRRRSLILALDQTDEYRFCVRCRANPRYELLADYLRERWSEFEHATVLELDPHSPLRPLLSTAATHLRTYFSADGEAGDVREDGARREDITRLSLPDESVDLIVSSEVLEHVPDLRRAFAETERVLRPGGRHVFTVPPRSRTQRRAEIVDGAVRHLTAPEYHGDPLDPRGILAYWDIGTEDAPDLLSTPRLRVEVVTEPSGRDRRVVWCATKLGSESTCRR